MVERWQEPKSNGKKGERHRSKWYTRAVEQQAKMTGELPHEIMLEWARTGVMKIAQIGKRKNGRVAAVRDEAGNIVYDEVKLNVYQRILVAKEASPYFAAKRSPQPAREDADKAAELAEIRRDSEEVRRRLMENLVLDEQMVNARDAKKQQMN